MTFLRKMETKKQSARFVFILSLFWFAFINASGQNYIRIDTANLAARQTKSKEYLEESKLYLNDFNKNFKGREKSFILKNFKEAHKEFNDELLRGDYILDARFDHYLDSIFNVIRAGNPQIPDGLKFYLSRNISLNAASMGDNRFIVNLGTFFILNNQHQLAAIISHELAHLMLNHHIKSLERYYRTEKQDAKQYLSSVKSSRWSRGEKALEKFRSMLYNNSSERRQEEFEADSMGYEIFKKTKFNNLEYANIYSMMALYDTIRPVGVQEKMYRKYFDLPGQPFNENWMKKEDFSSYDYSKYQSKFKEDSLKNHPEMKERVDKLKHLFPELNDSLSEIKPDSQYYKLNRIAEKERMFSLDFNEDYGVGIYLCLLHLQDDEKDAAFYKERMGEFFKKIAKARKEYTLNRYLERVSPKNQSESYITFLNFMWNLSLPELNNIADFYTKEGA